MTEAPSHILEVHLAETDDNKEKERATATAEPEAPAEDKPAGGFVLSDDLVDHGHDI